MTDIFPAIVTIYPPEYAQTLQPPFELVGFSDHSCRPYAEVRVIVHNSNVFVGTDSPRGPQTLFHDTYAPENVFNAPPYLRVLTDTGHLLVIGRSKGCGCGTQLRSWNPYGNIQRSSKG